MYHNNYINSVNLYQNTNFPYMVLDVTNEHSYPKNQGFQVMHWHEDLQFIYVFDGIINIKTLDENVQLQKGEGIFINTNVVHLVEKIENCHYNSFIFPAYFLEFYFGSPVIILVDEIIRNKNLPLYKLSSKTDWHNSVLKNLQKLAELEKNKTKFYTYEVLVLLCTLWLEIQKNIILPISEKNNVSNNRMIIFLKYINEHYSENISLDNLAASANVSKSECLRCFKNILHTTPYKYIMEFRLSKAADMLINTSKSIGEVAEATGFNQLSYFGKCFKNKMKCSPKEYKNEHK